MARLDVYITENCWACEESRRIIAEIAPRFPEIAFEIRNLSDERRPNQVFATPTYVLNDKTIFLGNPSREALIEKLEAI
jgi:hypothetical protein